MKATAVGRYARSVLAAVEGAETEAGEGRLERTVDGLARAAAFFAGQEGVLAANVIQSSRVPSAEREALVKEIAGALELPPEVAVLVDVLGRTRALRVLPAVAARASSVAEGLAETARVEIRTAMALPEGVSARIGAAMERILGRPVRVEVSEDAQLLAGVVVKSGDRIWDGSLRGRIARAQEALAAGDATSVA